MFFDAPTIQAASAKGAMVVSFQKLPSKKVIRGRGSSSLGIRCGLATSRCNGRSHAHATELGRYMAFIITLANLVLI